MLLVVAWTPLLTCPLVCNNRCWVLIVLGRALCTGTGPGFDPRHQAGVLTPRCSATRVRCVRCAFISTETRSLHTGPNHHHHTRRLSSNLRCHCCVTFCDDGLQRAAHGWRLRSEEGSDGCGYTGVTSSCRSEWPW